MSSDDWRSCSDPGTMLRRLIAQLRPDERRLRLFACACVRLAVEVLGDVDDETRKFAWMVIDFVERESNDGLRPSAGSELAELAELAELEDLFLVSISGYSSPLHPDAERAADWGIEYALGVYSEHQAQRAVQGADPALVRQYRERVEQARQGCRPLTPTERLIVRAAGLLNRGEALKSWFERPKGFDATTRASFERMSRAEAGAPWKIAEREARVAMGSRLCAMMREYFGGTVEGSEAGSS